MSWKVLIGPMGLALSLFGCGSSAIQQQSQAAAGHLAPTRAVAVAPLLVPPELAGFESALARLDSLILVELETSGLHVTGPEVYGRLWDKIAGARGGFYDPYTGALNAEQLDSARAQLAEILDDAYGASAVVYPSIEFAAASYEGRKASWDGVSQSHGIGGEVIASAINLLAQAIFGADNDSYEPEVETGIVPALSLVVVMQELNGSTLYQHRGGLEVFDTRWVKEGDILKDAKRARKAVEVALKPFTKAMDELPPVTVAQAGP